MDTLWTLLTAFVGGAWTLWVFSRDRRIRTAEHLLLLEKEYTTHLHTLLQIEYIPHYDEFYKTAVLKMVNRAKGVAFEDLTSDESKAIDRLEVVLRYLALCSHMRRLRIDRGYLTKLHSWYLLVLTNEAFRKDLREYLQIYWPDVYFWSVSAGRPWPRRVGLHLQSAPDRVKRWWRGETEPTPQGTRPNVLDTNRDADPPEAVAGSFSIQVPESQIGIDVLMKVRRL